MPRVNHVKKCRKSPGKCGRCGYKIRKGMPYLWWKFNFGAKYVRCDQPCCKPKPSDLTRSEFWGRIRDLEAEGFGGETFEDLTDSRQKVLDELEALAEECEEKYNNMPTSLQSGPTGEQLQGRVDACRDCAASLEAIDIPDEAPPESPEDSEDDEANAEYDEANNIYKSRVDEVRDELAEAFDISCD